MQTKSDTIQAQSDVEPQKNFTQAILERRATSHFKPDPIPDADLDEILRLAGQAPSGYNLQPWRFIVLRDAESKTRLQKVAFDQEKISEAPAVIIFLGMKEQTKEWARDIFGEGVQRGLGRPENMEKNMKGALDFISNQVGWEVWVNRHTMIAFSFAMLAAETLGYDTAPMEGFDSAGVKQEFGIPDEAEVVALLAIGRGKEPDKKYPGRLSLEKIVFAEKYSGAWNGSAARNG
ncbi:MAG: nitroreductase family protein [Verrucomicrobiota bacterium]